MYVQINVLSKFFVSHWRVLHPSFQKILHDSSSTISLHLYFKLMLFDFSRARMSPLRDFYESYL